MTGIGSWTAPDETPRGVRALRDRVLARLSRGAPDERRLVLWPLLAGIGLLFAIGIAALAGATWLAGREADALATAQSVGQVERVLAARSEALATMNLDWAYWNEGIERFVLQPDQDYADENLGNYAQETLGLYAVLVVGSDDRPGFAYREGAPADRAGVAEWLRQAAPLIARTRAESGETPATATAYLAIGGRLVSVAASAMLPEPGSPAIGWAQPPVLIFMEAMDETLLAAVAEAAGVQDLAVVPIESPSPRRLLLAGPDGSPVAALGFSLRLPSAAILARLWPVEIIIAVVLLAIGGLIAQRLLAIAARYQRERHASEFELSNAMLEARAASHAKSQFLANMSHEIRTPLNGVIGYAEMLKLGYIGGLNEKQMEYVASIEAAGRHLLALLQDVLDLAKIEAGREDLEEAELDVEALVAKAVALLGPRARERGVALVIESGVPARLQADSRRLLQMLLNLLSNAIRFAPGSSAVRVGWKSHPDGGFSLHVADSGPGIPESELARVTEPFGRRNLNAVRGDGESNGLGLPLTARLVALHGGRLLLENADAGGLVAELHFPASRYLGAATAADRSSQRKAVG
jgi:signal transduction histidine kinase